MSLIFLPALAIRTRHLQALVFIPGHCLPYRHPHLTLSLLVASSLLQL